MFEQFKLSKELKKIEIENKLAEQKFIKKQFESLDEGNNRLLQQFEDDDESKWMEMGNNEEKQLSVSDHKTLIKQAQLFYYKNSHARGIVRLYEKYITGRGFKIYPNTQDERWIEAWKNFEKQNRMVRRRKEIIRRGFRDGEVFIRFFYGNNGDVKIRFMNPLKVEDPDDVNDNTSYGIETDPDDIETVKNYYYGGKKIPADEVIHEKLFVDSDVKRGRSIFEPIARALTQYPDWITDRMKMHKIRAVMAVIRKVKGTTAQARNIAEGYKTTKLKASDGTEYARLPEGVSVVTTKPSIDYEFKTPNVQAGDAHNDGYALLNMIAAGPGLPNWMITSDPSNSNYASTMISEAPGVKEFQDWQDFFSLTFEEIFKKVITHALKKKIISDKEMVRRKEINSEGIEVEIEELQIIDMVPNIVYPELVHRDIFNETKALEMHANRGICSGHTYAARLDYDYDKEQEMIGQEEATRKEKEGDTEGEEEILDIEDINNEESFKKTRKKYIRR